MYFSDDKTEAEMIAEIENSGLEVEHYPNSDGYSVKFNKYGFTVAHRGVSLREAIQNTLQLYYDYMNGRLNIKNEIRFAYRRGHKEPGVVLNGPTVDHCSMTS